MQSIQLQYGRTGLKVDLPSDRVTLIEPRYVPGLADERAAFIDAARQPFGGRALRERIAKTDRVAIVIPDSTRGFPRDRLLPWLLAEIDHVPAGQIVIINGTGTHRANTPDELCAMLGQAVFDRYRVINNIAADPDTLALAGHTPDGRPVHYNREYVEADRRIVLGFIEPHFMAGFSGGYKGVFPGVAGLEAITHYHRAAVIGDPRSTWGRLEDNPTQDQIRANGALLPIDFLLNLTLNRNQEITGYFCGDVMEAHVAGCAFARETTMVPCAESFPIVVTSNSGYPLDQNVYQSVKGMSAAAQIVSDGGLIIAAAECSDGFPDHGNFRRCLYEHTSADAMLETIDRAPEPFLDQWQVQLLALILKRATVGFHSSLPDDAIRRAHLEPVTDVAARITAELDRIGPNAPIAVLPEGPMTIPYLS